MNRVQGETYLVRSAVGASWNGKVRAIFVAAVMLVASIPVIAQAGGAGGDLQAKLADVKQAVAANQQKLRMYQWIETTQLTLNGDAKPPSQSQCQYGPDGTVQKTPLTPPPPPPSGVPFARMWDERADVPPPCLLGFRSGLCSLLAALPMQIRNGGGQHSVLGAPRCEPIARRYASGEILHQLRASRLRRRDRAL